MLCLQYYSCRSISDGPNRPPIPVIRVHGLVSRFGAQVVHDGLDIEVLPNEIFGVVGGSGAGKSVLLRTILGLQQPQGGTRRDLRPGYTPAFAARSGSPWCEATA